MKEYRVKNEFWGQWNIDSKDDAIIEICDLNSHALDVNIPNYTLLNQVEDLDGDDTPYDFVEALVGNCMIEFRNVAIECMLENAAGDISNFLDCEWDVPAALTPELYIKLAGELTTDRDLDMEESEFRRWSLYEI